MSILYAMPQRGAWTVMKAKDESEIGGGVIHAMGLTEEQMETILAEGEALTQTNATAYLLFSEPTIIVPPPTGSAAQRQFWYGRLRAIKAQVKALECQRRGLLQEVSAITKCFEGIDAVGFKP